MIEKHLKTTMYNVTHIQIVTMASISPGSSSLLPLLMVRIIMLLSSHWLRFYLFLWV